MGIKQVFTDCIHMETLFEVMCSSLNFSFSGRNVSEFKELKVFIFVAGPSGSKARYLRSQFSHTHRLPLEERSNATLFLFSFVPFYFIFKRLRKERT